MTSPARIAANARNAQLSTGPRTRDGRARSSRNALKHGLTSKDVVLPGEDPQAFQDRLRQWTDYYQPDPAQLDVIERAVAAKWKLDRITRVETENLSTAVRHAARAFDRAAADEADELGRRLVNEPLNRCAVPQTADPDARARLDRRAADLPSVLTRRLQANAAGVDWLLGQWTTLARMLAENGFWHYPEKIRALRLLGCLPQDLMEDTRVQRVVLACNIAHPEANGQHNDAFTFLDECIQLKLGIEDRPMYERQVWRLAGLRPSSREEAVAILCGVVEEEVQRLRALRAELAPVHEADRAGAAQRALFDASPEAALMRRYETALEREFHRSIADLMKLRTQMPASDDTPGVDEEPAGPLGGPNSEPAAPPEPPAVRNEPNAEPPAPTPVAPPPPAKAAVPTAPAPSSRPAWNPNPRATTARGLRTPPGGPR